MPKQEKQEDSVSPHKLDHKKMYSVIPFNVLLLLSRKESNFSTSSKSKITQFGVLLIKQALNCVLLSIFCTSIARRAGSARRRAITFMMRR